MLKVKKTNIEVPGYILEPYEVSPEGIAALGGRTGADVSLRMGRKAFTDFIRDGRTAQPYVTYRLIDWLAPSGFSAETTRGNSVVLVGPEEDLQARDGSNRRKWGIRTVTETGIEFSRPVARMMVGGSPADVQLDGFLVGDLREVPMVKVWWFTIQQIEFLAEAKAVRGKAAILRVSDMEEAWPAS